MAKTSRAFVFSLDAFVAFTLVLVVIHALVFLAAVPSSYYGGLMQASYLARDTLDSLVFASAGKALCDPGNEDYENCLARYEGKTMLDYVVANRDDPDVIRERVGALIPDQFGYRLELIDSSGQVSETVYDTANPEFLPPAETHNKLYNKLQASAHSLYFGYTDAGRRGFDNPYCYMTCNPEKYPRCPNVCEFPKSRYNTGDATLGLVRLTVYR